VALVAILAAWAVAADEETGFTRLFNGKDLTGWEGDPKVWSVQDGAIRCESPEEQTRNWLVWRGGTPGDFELRLRFRFTRGNSGVQVRSKEIEKCMVRGYQVEVAAREKMGLWHHSISPSKHRSHLATAGQKVQIAEDGRKTVESIGAPERIQAAYRENDWNDLTVIADGPRLVQIINGTVFAELIDEEKEHSARSGVVAFQDHGRGTVVEFKDVRLKRLR
jgi:hypothetical protein